MQNLKISLLCTSLLVMLCSGLVLFRPVLPWFHPEVFTNPIVAISRSTTSDESPPVAEVSDVPSRKLPDREEADFDWAANDDWADRVDDRIHTIRSLADWNTTISEGRVVLFLDAAWSLPVTVWRRPFLEFSNWCHESSACSPVRVQLCHHDEEWATIFAFRDANSIPFKGDIYSNGAGQVVWLKDGHVLDHSLCHRFPDAAAVIARTKAVFGGEQPVPPRRSVCLIQRLCN